MSTIYPCITTLTKGNWLKQINELKKYNLTEVGVFLTGIEYEERQKLYQALKESIVKYVPHVHARHDMDIKEIEFFINNYQTKQFNVHGNNYLDLKNNKYFNKYFLIETTEGFSIENFKKFPEYCIDLAHVFCKSPAFSGMNFKKEINSILLSGKRPAANHISGLNEKKFSKHYIKDLNMLDYLKKIPKQYFAEVKVLEVENLIKEQIEFIKYIKTII